MNPAYGMAERFLERLREIMLAHVTCSCGTFDVFLYTSTVRIGDPAAKQDPRTTALQAPTARFFHVGYREVALVHE